jgi:hypothetical protein
MVVLPEPGRPTKMMLKEISHRKIGDSPGLGTGLLKPASVFDSST